MNKRVFLIVLDSVGIGAMPDAHLYGDVGANTLASCGKVENFALPTLKKLGLFNIDDVNVGKELSPIGAFGRMAEKSQGKDTTIGHWEISGIVSENPLPTYPNGFPKEIIDEYSKLCGRKILCNKPYSGTELLKDFGKEHMDTGALLVYTSADSVFQVAAHEDIVPINKLYEYCEIARNLLVGVHGVGRVIARPFVGEYPNFKRTANRHDYSLAPPKNTFLDTLKSHDYKTVAVGKIYDIFAGKGISESYKTKDNQNGMDITSEIATQDFSGLSFVNLVDFDMQYGHRNDVIGYAHALMEFDKWLDDFIKQLKDGDLLMITADHGCDPLHKGTDHTREYTPMVAYSKNIKPNTNLGTRESFADIGATILDYFNLPIDIDGKSFLKEII